MRTSGNQNGPTPRLAPVFTGDPAGDQSAYDALADLFLGEAAPVAQATDAPLRLAGVDADSPGEAAPASPATRSADTAEGVHVEALLLGHLPVLAGPWAGQYASSVSARLGAPVGLVRLSAGWGSVELYGAAHTAPPADSMRDAIRVGRERAPHWLVRVDTTEELDLLRSARPDAVTLLTGANEAAVVAGYRSIKAAAAALEPGCEFTGGSAARMGVAIVGAPPEQARDTAAKLARTVNAYLGIELETSPALQKLEGVARTRLFEGETDVAPGDLIGWLRGTVQGEPGGVAPGDSHPPSVDRADFAEPAAYTGVFNPGATATPPSVQPSEHDAERRLTDVLLRAAPASRCETGAASLAKALGLTPIPVACPVEPTVELAMDSSGAAHIVAPHGPRALDALRNACDWLRDHGSIVARVEGVRGFAPDARATLHVVTADAPSVRRLLDTSFRVHLRAPSMGGAVVDLN